MKYPILRHIGAGLLTAACVLVTQAAAALTTAIPKGDIVINLELLCEGLTSPVTATHAAICPRHE